MGFNTRPAQNFSKFSNSEQSRKGQEATTWMLVAKLQSNVQDNEVNTEASNPINSTASGVVGFTADADRNVTAQEEYTRFTDSALIVSEPVSVVGTQVDDLEDTASVVSFLQRPCLLYYATLTSDRFKPLISLGESGPVTQPYIYKFVVPNDTMKFGKRIEKLQNFQWFKADVVFRIMTNVNPFIAGRLWACFAPYDNMVEPVCSILSKSRAGVTSYPGTEIDLQSANAAEIRIPWSGLGDAFSLTSAEAPIGNFYLFAITPLLAQGTPKVPLQVYSWFENISLNAPTPQEVRLQANDEAKGPISEVASKVQRAADILAPLPVVGSVASTVSWVSGAVSKVASIFGWSRPVEGSGAPAVTVIPGRGYTNFKCQDQSTMLAFANDNSIAEKEVNFLENVDEMSIEHICSRPALIDVSTWGAGHIPLAQIGQYRVGPHVGADRTRTWKNKGGTTSSAFDLTLFELMSTRFGMWKADVHFRISVVRTPFHVGRFEVFYVPFVDSLNNVDLIDTTNLYRHVIDITETNELEFVVPYMHQKSMISSSVMPSAATNDTPGVGVVCIRALSPLNCPDTVAQSVSVNVWKWATNVAFACPLGMGLQVPDPVSATLQGIVRNEEENIKTVTFGKKNQSSNVLDTCQVVAGENCFNLRQATRSHRVFPHEVKDKTLLNGNVVGNFGGYVGLAANIFAFYRGGLSFKIVPTEDLTTVSSIRTSIVRTLNKKPVSYENASHWTFPSITPFHEIQVPYYSQTRRSLCNAKVASAGPDAATSQTPGVYIECRPSNAPLTVLVGGKDDLTFGYLIGPPIYTLQLAPSPKPFKMETELAELQINDLSPDFRNNSDTQLDVQDATAEKTHHFADAIEVSRVPNVSHGSNLNGSCESACVCKEESRPLGVQDLPQVVPSCLKEELKHVVSVARVTTPPMDCLNSNTFVPVQSSLVKADGCVSGCCRWSRRNMVRWGKKLSQLTRHDLYLPRGDQDCVEMPCALMRVCSQTIFWLVQSDGKQRFEVDCYGRVRARWGHSHNTQCYRVPSELEVAYHSTTIAAKSSIQLEGLLPMRREFVHMAATPAGTRCNRPVLYEIDLVKLQEETSVYQEGEVVLAKFVPPRCIRSVTIYGRKFTLKHASLQGLGDYNPLNLVANTNKALADVSATSATVRDFVAHGQHLLETVTSTIKSAQVSLFGASAQSVITRVFKILCNALMAKREMLAVNILFNVSIEFGSVIFSAVKSILGITSTLQSGLTDWTSFGWLDNFIDTNKGLCAAGLGALLAVVLQCCLGLPQTKSIDSAIKFFGDRSRGLKNIFDFASVTMPMFTAIGSYLIACRFGGPAPELDEFLTGYKQWTEEVVEIATYSDPPFAVRIEKDVKLVYKVERLYRKSLEYASTINVKGIRGPSVVHYQKMSKIIEELRKQCDYTGVFGNRPRVKPLVVQLFGESGVGKSGMSWPLSCDLNAAFSDTLESARDFASEIYFRNTEQEFWDGYAGQNIVVYDDFGQRADTMTAPNEEFMELIRAANLAPYPLHMADLPEKKRTKFSSKAIILTSNVLEQNVSSLTFPDAYRRRIDVCGRVINKPEYTKQCFSKTTRQQVERLDTMKCDGPVDTTPYLVQLYDAESQEPIFDSETGRTKTLDYEQFLELCLGVAKRSFKNSQEVNSALEERLTEERFAALHAKFQGYTRKNGKSIFSLDDSDDEFEEPEDADWLTVASDLRSRFMSAVSEMMTLKNCLILAGLVIAGLGAWKWLSGGKTTHHKVSPPRVRLVPEAACSGDNVTRRAPTTIVEAFTSGDSVTKHAPKLLHEAIRGATNSAAEKLVAEAAVSGDSITRNKRSVVTEAFASGDSRTKNIKRTVVESNDAELQVWKDASAQDLITHRILANLYKIIRVRGGVEVPVLNGLFVRDNIMLVPRHLRASLLASDTIRLENGLGVVYTMPVSSLTFCEIQARDQFTKDAMLVQCPRYVAAHSDIVKHFQTMPELAVRRVDVCVPTIRSVGKRTVLTILGNVKANFDAVCLSTEQGVFNIRDALRYTLNTRDGDCGAPVICQENSMIRKIAGIHIAALTDGTQAFGQSVTQNDLVQTLKQFTNVVVTDNDNLPGFALKKFDAELQFDEDYSVEDMVTLCGSVAPSFGFVGMCEKAPFSPNKTDIRKSVIHGKVTEPITAPSCLYSKDVDVMEKNMGKNAINTDYIPRDEVMRCVNEVKVHLLNNREARLARVLTFEEAVSGSEASPYISGLNRGSSPGFPWVLQRPTGTPGKTHWFGTTDYEFSEEVRECVNSRIEAAKNGIRLPTVWTDTLKDERRPIEKVAAKKTRVFANGPMDYTIAFRMYFLGFIAHIMENRINNEQSLGTNPYDMDWEMTAKKLSKFGKHVFAGDFSSFDGTLNTCIMEHFVEVANEFYGDGVENATIRRVLFLDVFNSIHLCQGVYITLTHSQPSGNPATTALNSFYNSVSMRLAYYRCAKKAGVEPPRFDDVVSMVSYGDDNVINFSENIIEWFNQPEVTEAYATFGMIYTDEAKTGNVAPKSRLLSEVAYLKRKFRQTPEGIWRAPMPVEVIMETPNWIRYCPDFTEATRMNVEDSIRELAQHERAVFDKYSPQLISAFYEETGEYPLVYTYDSYCEEWNQAMGLIMK